MVLKTVMAIESQSSEFSWVRKRSECSLWPVFKKLEMDMRQDANDFMALNSDENDRVAVTASDNGNLFGVYCGRDSDRAAQFSFHRDHIEISRGKETFTVTLTLDDDCKCKLLVYQDNKDARVLDHWQLRKMILESLFFRS